MGKISDNLHTKKLVKLSLLYAKLLAGHGGTFRPLKVGEPIEESDIQICHSWVNEISEHNIGRPRNEGEVIMRLEFEKE